MQFIDRLFPRQQPSLYQPGHTIVDWAPGRDGMPIQDIPAEPVKDQFKIRLAGARNIRSDASQLVEQRYMQRGYGQQAPVQGPHCQSIVAYEGQEVIGTLSIRFDSDEGLYCDDLYQEEIDALRADGRRVCELIKFAATTSSHSIKTLTTALFHVAFIYAHKLQHYDDVVIEVNPHHVKFYQRALGFQVIGPQRTNRRVNAPAILMRCEFANIGKQIKQFSGSGKASGVDKTLYPRMFSEQEEQGIFRRLAALLTNSSNRRQQ